MGVYRYTLRKNTTKVIDTDTGAPVEIGSTEYAYKYSYGWDSGNYKRNVAKLEAAADRAREANPNLVLIVVGNLREMFNRGDVKETEVYLVGPNYVGHDDTRPPSEKIVGYIRKNGRRYEMVRC